MTTTNNNAYTTETVNEMIADHVAWMNASRDERNGYQWYGTALGVIALAHNLGVMTYEDATAKQNDVTLAMYEWRQKIKNA